MPELSGALPRPRAMGDERLIAALRAQGCAMCRYRDDVTTRELQSMHDEQVTDRDIRRRFIEGGGFCPRHVRASRAVERGGSGGQTGSAILYASMLRARLAGIERAGGDPARRARAIEEASRPAGGCLVCAREKEAIIDAAARLVAHAEADELWAHWVLSAHYCLEHLTGLVSDAPKRSPIVPRLLEAQTQRLQALLDRLDAFVHNASSDRIAEQTDDQRAAVSEAEYTLGGSAAR